MTFEEMQNYLNNVQMEMTQSKIMNAMLVCFKDIKTSEEQIRNIEKAIYQISTSLNELIAAWNQKFGSLEEKVEQDNQIVKTNEKVEKEQNINIPENIFQDDMIVKSENLIDNGGK